MSFSIRGVALASLCAAAAVASVGAGAQQVYRITGPDGRVTFSDKPPENARAAAAPSAPPVGASAQPGDGLPFELRTVANRFPVTLYTGTDCGPCDSGRAFLRSRGIPHAERTISTNDDIEALKRISGGARLPFLTIAGQHINGFAEPEWAKYLDAAGYPRSSRLPPSYRHSAPAPLVAVQVAPVAPAKTEQQPARAQMPSLDAPANPAGIRF